VARWHNFVTPGSGPLKVEVAVVPYTYEHTNIRDREPGDAVNLEGDILGKYVERYLEARKEVSSSKLTVEQLVNQGF
jgi:riboflavin synthase